MSFNAIWGLKSLPPLVGNTCLPAGRNADATVIFMNYYWALNFEIWSLLWLSHL